ncbi:pyridoxal phosphate-dependent transferase [Glomus cerebriforme]|uniref:Pyridoxal phosphate-dependent transferase n=1 Tax=Glomus cerebriforme TaxID=658196 RepID=A0A397SVW1_9GLOM|nr:pyridoxal phosphate-dependent transferase [Glomus cerebriforme]
MKLQEQSQDIIDLCGDAVELDLLVSQMKNLMVEHINEGRKPGALVVEYKPPEELKTLIDLDLPYTGIGVSGLMPLLQNVLRYSVNSWNPGFMDKLYAGTNPVGIITEMLIALLNANSHVYHVSPVLTLIENSVSEKLARLLGMGEKSGGITCPGGAFSNQLAMLTARNYMFPEIKTKGYCNFGKKLIVFTSSGGHYSIEKTGMALGLGIDNIVKVPCDDQGRMRTDELERLIIQSLERKEAPFFINATAGTTVLGAFDPLKEIGKIAKQYKLWFHVDGSWGGSLLFSDEHRHLIEGSSLADTFVLNPHKLLGTPLQCSFLLASDRQIFRQSNSLGAQYLFHDDSKYDLGDGTLGCGRRPDAIKLFIGWKIYGIIGYKQRIEHAFKMAKYLTNLVKKNSRFRMVLESPPNLQVCFWYVPKRMIILDQEEKESKKYQTWKEQMSLVTKEIHKRLQERGRFLIDYSPLELNGKELPPFFRVVINAPSINEHYLDELVKEFEGAGEGVLEYLEENKKFQNGLNITNGNCYMNGNGHVGGNGVLRTLGRANGNNKE